MQKSKISFLSLLMALTLVAVAFVNMPTTVRAAPQSLSAPYSQNFDSLSNTGTTNPWANDSTLAGWHSNRTVYLASDGGLNNGGLYSYGTTSTNERALGSVGSGSANPVLYAVALINDTGAEITGLTISFRGEQWRNANANAHTLTLDYQLNPADITSGTWIDAPAFTYTSPITGGAGVAVDGNANAININGTLNVTIPANSQIWLRWEDLDNTGADHGLAIDNVSVSATGGATATATPTMTSTNTPGGPTETPTNTPTETPVGGACATTTAKIYELQENGAKFGQAGPWTVVGVVTGDFQFNAGTGVAQGLEGFYIQDATGDGNANTSDGIFVYEGDDVLLSNVLAGQVVLVSGTVTEQFNQTQLNATAIVNCGTTGVITPTSITLPVAAVTDWEKTEGMLITVTAATGSMSVTEMFQLHRFGEVIVSSGGRLFQPTNFNEPGTPAIAQQAENDRRRILIDDGSGASLPTANLVPYIPNTTTYLRMGWTTNTITGVLGFGFSQYRIHPTTTVSFSNTDGVGSTRPATTAPSVGGTLRVAAFNVLNFFNGNGLGAGFPTSRGADSVAEFQRQSQKIGAAILGLNADIIALNELENDDTAAEYSAIETLVDGLNTGAPGTYAFIDTGIVGGDEIRVAIIYKPAKVQPVGTFATLDNVPPFNVNTRPPVAQLFEEVGTGERFYVIGNHFKSKSTTGCPSGSDPNADSGDGQGCWNGDRKTAATALLNWINTDVYFDTDPDVLIIGDLNSYAQEDPIDLIKAGGYTNLIEQFIGAGNVAYSYVFGAQSGYLDHALANASLLSQVTGAAEWHINADEPLGRDYNDATTDSSEGSSELRQAYLFETNAFRASDHDPVIVGLDLSGNATSTPTNTPESTATATNTPDLTVTATNTPAGTATATNTPDLTNSPTPTPTATNTETAGTELLLNGGFETDANTDALPDNWTLTNPTGEKLKCDTAEKDFAFEGTCAFQFKGSVGERSKLAQNIVLENFTFTTGDTLTLNAYVRASNPAAQGKFKVRIQYTATNIETGKININITQAETYTLVNGTTNLASGDIAKIKVQIDYRSLAGKVFVDGVSLKLETGSALIPMP